MDFFQKMLACGQNVNKALLIPKISQHIEILKREQNKMCIDCGQDQSYPHLYTKKEWITLFLDY